VVAVWPLTLASRLTAAVLVSSGVCTIGSIGAAAARADVAGDAGIS
jgi:hypothetical protein